MNTARQHLGAASRQLLKRRLLSGGGWALVSKILVPLAGLISSALLARLLTPQALGTYFLAISIVWRGTSLGALGLTGTVVRLVAQGMGLNLFGRVRRVIGVVLAAGGGSVPLPGYLFSPCVTRVSISWPFRTIPPVGRTAPVREKGSFGLGWGDDLLRISSVNRLPG